MLNHQQIARLLVATILIVVAPFSLAKSAGEQLHKLFAEDWEWSLKQFPTFASSLGDHRYDDRLSDRSPAALKARRQHLDATDKALKAIPRQKLSAQDKISYDLYRYDLDNSLALERLHANDSFGEEWSLIGHLDGIHISFSQMASSTRFETVADYQNYLARLAGVPTLFAQAIDIARQAQAAGWSLPKITVERVPGQIDRLIGTGKSDFSWYAPFITFPANIPAAEAKRLQAEADQLIAGKVVPVLREFQRYMRDDYGPKARSTIAAASLPNGQAYYAQLVRQMTTTNLTPAQIHEMGLKEVARITSAIEGIARQEGFAGSAGDFVKSVRARPDQYYATGDELVAAYGALGKKVDPLMTGVVKELPRLPWGVRAAPPEEKGSAAHYLPGAPDGSRAGYFILDASSPQNNSKFDMMALLLHEAVPGHHLQTARAAELNNLPQFRRYAWYVAYGEGWALYAESLGEELGLYATPLDLLGRYTYEIWRAARLVVDTGMHSLGWSRQQAIDYMSQATGDTSEEVTNEIDRYIVWPGQALGYKIGELTIKRLRKEGETALGDKFDRRAFHSMVLDAGALPLAVLEQRSKEWIAAGGK